MSRQFASRTSARTLVALMGAVVLSFVIATVFAQFRAAAIDGRVADIVSDSLPSVQSLSLARSGLQHEITLLNRLTRHPTRDFQTIEFEALASRRERLAAFESYLAYPAFPKEHEETVVVERLSREFDSAVEKLTGIAGRSKPAALSAAFAIVERRATLLDDGYRRLVDINLAQGQRLGLEISRIRWQSLAIAVGLDLTAIALSVMAALLAIRVHRGSVRSLEKRASELETFSGRVAHDLKGPLSGLLLAVSLGERTSSAEKLRDIYWRIKKLSERMTGIVDSLFEFARSGAHPDRGATSELAPAIEDTLNAVRDEAAQAKTSLITTPMDASMKVACTSGALASILGNLVRNAIKFIVENGERERKVTLSAKRIEKRIRVEIQDTGPGIEADRLATVFDPYVRASRSQPGLGLGLATVKKLVEGYGGRVGVISVPDRGSTFWFELPETKAPSAIEPKAS